MSKYLIFGATGSIGTKLAEELYKSNKEIHLIGRDEDQLKILSSKLNCDYTVLDILNDNISGFVKDKFKDIDHIYIQEDTDHKWSRDWSYWINDNMVFHRRDMYDCDLVHKLHKEKRLWPAEYGWYQMLSSMDNHHCVYGGACIERFAHQLKEAP